MKLIGRPSREKLPRYVQQVKAGERVYWYLRAPGRERMKLEIPSGSAPRSPGFLAIYHAALSGAAPILPASAIGQSRSAAGTVSAAIAAYYQATAFTGLGERTRSSRRGYLEKFRGRYGDLVLARINLAAGLKTELGIMSPNVQKAWLTAMRGFLAFATAEGYLKSDTTIGIKRAKIGKTDGFATWQPEHLRAFEDTWSLDSPERVAFALARWTLARRGDLIRFTWQQVRLGDAASPHGYLEWMPRKTARSTGVRVRLPILPELEEVLRWHRPKAPAAIGPILVNLRGRPYSEDSFAKMFRAGAKQAEIPEGYSAHGLRKTGVCKLLEAGVTPQDIMAVTGHSSLEEVELYGRKFARPKRAAVAMAALAAAGR